MILATPQWAILIAVGLGLAILAAGFVVAFQGRNEVSDRIKHFIETPPAKVMLETTEDSVLDRLRAQFNSIFGVIRSEGLHKNLISGNWPVTVSEYVFIQVSCALLLFLLGLLIFRSIAPGIGLAMLAYLAPGFFLFRSIQARQKKFQEQLIDALTLIRGAVEAGYSFQQSLNVVIQEMDPPISEEFRQVRREVELGLPISRALVNMAVRMESDDFHMVVTAVNINMQVGGNLTVILGIVIETIRQRNYLFGEMRALTSYANFASYLLTLMPFATIAILSIVSPLYWERLFEPGITRMVLLYAAGSLFIGNIVLRRIAKIEV